MSGGKSATADQLVGTTDYGARRLLAEYLATELGSSTSDAVRAQLAGLLSEAAFQMIVASTEQVHILREMCDELARLRGEAEAAR